MSLTFHRAPVKCTLCGINTQRIRLPAAICETCSTRSQDVLCKHDDFRNLCHEKECTVRFVMES